MFVGILGFPGSGQSTALSSMGLNDLGGTANWKALLPEHRPFEKVARDGVVTSYAIPFTRVIHLMRYPWHAISAALAELTLDELVLIRTAVGIHPKTPACHLETEVSKIKVLTLAFPKWYDMIRELEPDSIIKAEMPAVTTVDHKLAVSVAGELAANQVEVIARNLYKRAPVV